VLVPRAADGSKSALGIVRAGVERYRRGVSILPIRFYGDPVLNEVTTEIEDIDGRIAALAESMIETMYEAPGVGLAANQIGVQKRMFVYDQGDGDGAFVVINPTIVETDGEWTFLEGCLSVPGLSWEITRANSVHLIGYDLEGNELDIETDEYEGRIFQHEMDHLNGMLLIERLDADQRREAKILLREQRLQIAANDPDGLHRLFGE
jgi:peptide deformylase